MSHNDVELSIQSGSIVELYKFTFESTNQIIPYTSARVITNFDGINFMPNPINRSNITFSSNVERSNLEFQFPFSDQFAAQIVQGRFDGDILVDVYRLHSEDVDAEVVLYWSGTLVKSGVSKFKASLEFTYDILSDAAQSSGRNIMIQCKHALYSSKCGVSYLSRRVMLPVVSVANRDITVASLTYGSYPRKYYGGIAEFGGEMRAIESSSGNTITVNRAFLNLAQGDMIGVAEGCGKSLLECGERFSNDARFGGFPWASKEKNPLTHLIW